MGKVPMSQKAQRFGWRQAHSRPPPGQDIIESPMQQPGSQQDRAQPRPKCVASLGISGVLSLPSSTQSLGLPTHLSSVPELQAGPEQSKLVSGQARWREAPMSARPVVGSQGHCEAGRELREEPGRCLVAPGPASSLPPPILATSPQKSVRLSSQ